MKKRNSNKQDPIRAAWYRDTWEYDYWLKKFW